MGLIVGIGGYTMDSAACIVRGGDLLAAAEEERFTRKKFQGGMPYRALKYCLEVANAKWDDVDDVGFCYRPDYRLRYRIPYYLRHLFKAPAHSVANIMKEVLAVSSFRQQLANLLAAKTRLHYIEHHLGHAACAFFASPFEEAGILTYDERGEWATGMLAIGRGNKIEVLERSFFPNSLGLFYSAITLFCGFATNSDEYKLMGLAAYGKPTQVDRIRKFISHDGEGRFRLNTDMLTYHYAYGAAREKYFNDRFTDVFGKPNPMGGKLEDYHADVAASAQKVLEEIVLAQARRLLAQAGLRKLCIAGGVGLNCSANGKFLAEGICDEIFVPPAASDSGLCVGNALYIQHALQNAPRSGPLPHAYWGSGFKEHEIESALRAAKVAYERPEDLAETTADLLAGGAIVGWFQGRSEWGPRALGDRSILADPTRPDMKDILNKWVKHREEFRPFAPIVTEEDAHRIFQLGSQKSSPFMTIAVPVVEEWREKLPAITHVNGTARLQTVNASNPELYRLLRAFQVRRGVPVLVNTSFNVMGEPIVNTPTEALRCFYSTGIDALAIGPFLLRKPGVQAA